MNRLLLAFILSKRQIHVVLNLMLDLATLNDKDDRSEVFFLKKKIARDPKRAREPKSA